jgi:hypothetical protein
MMEKKMKISLSASFWGEAEVAKVLETCDKIYTTQVRNYQALIARFGDKVYIIPDARPDLLEFLASREEAEVIGFQDLYHIHQLGSTSPGAYTFDHGIYEDYKKED